MEEHETWVREKNGASIRGMFNSIAHRYDLANHVLSVGVDRYWRTRVRTELQKLFPTEEPSILDVCCGTGDLSLELCKLGQVVAVDFAGDMLRIGKRKTSVGNVGHGIRFFEADCLQLPFKNESFDIATAAFGVRNFEHLSVGLLEMSRVIRPGGAVAILEFSKPHWPAFSTAFRLYFKHILPLLGGLLTGQREPYRYLPASVESFVDPEYMDHVFRGEGINHSTVTSLTGGIARLYIGQKAFKG